jgi:tRNA nucleotidyltransferase (CCA-adding enzyme)
MNEIEKKKKKYGYIKLRVFEVYGSNCKNSGTSGWLNEVFLSIN